jgi:murein DD-endopeptidase MepM/ murein hydrolase activator NlpD
MEKKNQSLREKLSNKFKLTIYNETTLHESFTFNLTKMNVFTISGLFLILIIALVIVLFIVTPLNQFLPKYSDTKMRLQIFENTIKVDSLENEILMRDKYFQNIKNIMEGKNLDDYEESKDTSIMHYENIDFTKSKHDSILRKLIEEEELLSLSVVDDYTDKSDLEHITFFPPVKGIISNKFNSAEGHYGIDLVGSPDEPILATLNGTVILATWSLETGYVIQIQHDNNLLSIYKHNSVLLKNEGDHVIAGESIAIIGNSGELSTGPHLHFELWHNGIPLDPESYIVF